MGQVYSSSIPERALVPNTHLAELEIVSIRVVAISIRIAIAISIRMVAIFLLAKIS